jgi:hypothetical protein
LPTYFTAVVISLLSPHVNGRNTSTSCQEKLQNAKAEFFSSEQIESRFAAHLKATLNPYSE